MPSIRSAAELKRGRRPRPASPARARREATRASCSAVELLLEPPQLLAGFGQLVGDRQRRHHGQPRVADLAELAAQLLDALVEVLGELLQMVFLAVLAGHAELAAVDGDVHLRHGSSSASAVDPSPRAPSWMLSIAASSRRAISRLAASSRRERAVCGRGRRRAWRGRCRAHAPARRAIVPLRSASRRRSTAASSASSACASRRVAAVDRARVGHRLDLASRGNPRTDAMKIVASASI